MSNPFELRFSMFTEAKSLLTEQYHMERDNLISKYHADVDSGLSPDFPSMPAFPSFKEIEVMANDINRFVSSK